MKRKPWIIVAVIVLLAGVAGVIALEFKPNSICYVQIDNSRVTELSDGGDMPYEYTLTGYDAKGRTKSVRFKAYRILREDAYLALEMGAFGVIRWKEAGYDELPNAVQQKMK